MKSDALLIGPWNACGQARLWCAEVRRERGTAARSFAAQGAWTRLLGQKFLEEPPDVNIPHHRLSPVGYRALRVKRLLRKANRLLVESATSVLTDPRSPLTPGEASKIAERFGCDVGLVFHGSELRDPDAHMARHPYSYFKEAPPEWLEARRRQCVHSQTLIAAGLPHFVTTPDLLHDAPGATWLPLVVRAELWQGGQPPFDHTGPPRVLHVPSTRTPSIKGTTHVLPVLEGLATKGRIELHAPDYIAPRRMPDLMRHVDVVVDQIQTGSYGVTAVESMAAGRLVVGNLSGATHQALLEAPIVSASPSSFDAVMDQVLADEASSAGIAALGPAHVAKHHDGRAALAALSTFITGGTP